ncbi:MAG TPA: hypothetical protein VIT43_03360 [Candidatus Dormibacteraeota bacterium]
MAIAEESMETQDEKIARLTAQVEALTARLEALEGGTAPAAGHEPKSRRDLLKIAGAAAAGAAGSILLNAMPAAATDGNNIKIGTSVGNDGQSTTTIWPNTATTSPLFEATGESVPQTTTVPPTISNIAPTSQTIPLIGAIGAGGSLPRIGSPTPQPDYPGFAPIQGVGGLTTQTVLVNGTQQTAQYSEGVNGYGAGATGIGVTGESDVGYGVAGGSGGIDLAAIGSGRVLQLSLIDSLLTNPPAGPPNYAANQYEQVRDGNGILWLSNPAGAWRRVNSVIPMTPFRLYDSRNVGGPRGANSITDISVAGVNGIPADAVGVFGNLTVLGPPTDGFLTMFPKGGGLNPVNSLNYFRGVSALSNHVMVGLGTNGFASVFVSGNGPANFLFDVFGYVI